MGQVDRSIVHRWADGFIKITGNMQIQQGNRSLCDWPSGMKLGHRAVIGHPDIPAVSTSNRLVFMHGDRLSQKQEHISKFARLASTSQGSNLGRFQASTLPSLKRSHYWVILLSLQCVCVYMWCAYTCVCACTVCSVCAVSASFLWKDRLSIKLRRLRVQRQAVDRRRFVVHRKSMWCFRRRLLIAVRDSQR